MKTYEELLAENEALAAQVDVLRTAVLNAISFMSGGTAKAQLRDAYDATPQQCLAEIRAEAGRAGFMECVKFVRLGIDPNSDHADIYAAKIRKGEL